MTENRVKNKNRVGRNLQVKILEPAGVINGIEERMKNICKKRGSVQNRQRHDAVFEQPALQFAVYVVSTEVKYTPAHRDGRSDGC